MNKIRQTVDKFVCTVDNIEHMVDKLNGNESITLDRQWKIKNIQTLTNQVNATKFN